MTEAAKVLVVDDDALVRRTFARYLRRSGIEVVEAGDGAEALRVFQEARPDAILLDLWMPGMSGMEVLAVVHDERPETPVIMVTGDGTVTNAVEALRRGAWDFVMKPVSDPHILLQAVRRAMEKAALLRDNLAYQAHLEALNGQLAGALAELRADHEAGRALQRQLLPPEQQRIGPFDLEQRLFPSQYLSGDFIDFFPVGERHVGFYLADVSGHGAASAFVTTMLAALVHGFRDAYAGGHDATIMHPARMLARLNEDLLTRHIDKHVSLVVGLLDCDAERLKLCSAGFFPYPMLRRRGGEVEVLERPARPLGLFAKCAYEAFEVAFGEGDALLVASDGVLEVGGELQAERVTTVTRLLGASDDMATLVSSLGLMDGGPDARRDDAAVLLIRRRA